jgi:hypothetical protein
MLITVAMFSRKSGIKKLVWFVWGKCDIVALIFFASCDDFRETQINHPRLLPHVPTFQVVNACTDSINSFIFYQ